MRIQPIPFEIDGADFTAVAAFSADRPVLAIGNYSGQVYILVLTPTGEIDAMTYIPAFSTYPVYAIALVADAGGIVAAVSHLGGGIYIHHIDTQGAVRTSQPINEPAAGVRFIDNSTTTSAVLLTCAHRITRRRLELAPLPAPAPAPAAAAAAAAPAAAGLSVTISQETRSHPQQTFVRVALPLPRGGLYAFGEDSGPVRTVALAAAAAASLVGDARDAVVDLGARDLPDGRLLVLGVAQSGGVTALGLADVAGVGLRTHATAAAPALAPALALGHTASHWVVLGAAGVRTVEAGLTSPSRNCPAGSVLLDVGAEVPWGIGELVTAAAACNQNGLLASRNKLWWVTFDE